MFSAAAHTDSPLIRGLPMWVRVCAGAMALFLAGCDEFPQAAAPVEATAAQQFSFASSSASLVTEGQRVARVLGCLGCHESNLQGAVWDEEPEFGVVAPSNLARSAERYSDSELEHMIREGVRPDGSALWEMPSEAFTHLSSTDMRALLAFLNSVPPAGPERPRPTFGPGARQEIKAGKLLSAPQKVARERDQQPWSGGSQHEHGRYIARLACGECHGPQLAGNEEPFRPDLIVAGGYSSDEFKRLMHTGEPTGGRKLKLMAQVSKSRFHHLRPAEVEAVHRYLVARAEKQP